MNKEYGMTYLTRYNFLTWCNFWIDQGCVIRHTSWKPNYPNFKIVERSSEELVEKHSYNKYIHKDKEYYTIDDKDNHLFFDRKVLNKGEWVAKAVNNIVDLFE